MAARLQRSVRAVIVAAALVVPAGCTRHVPKAPSPPPAAAPDIGPIPKTLAEAEEARREGRREAYELGLRNLTTSDDPTVRRRARALLGHFEAAAGRHDRAAQHYHLAEIEAPELAPYLRLYRMRAERAAGDAAAALEVARTIVADFPSTPAATSARIAMPRLLVETNQHEAAVAAMVELESVAVDEFTDDELVAAAVALDAAGSEALATRIRFRVLQQWPQSEHAEAAYERLAALPPESSPLAQLDFAGAVALIDRLARVNRFDQALDLIRRTLEKDPSKADDPAFRHLHAKSLFDSRHYDEVVTIAAPNGDPYHLDIELLRARAFWRTDRNPEFLAILERIVKEHPKTRHAASARVLLSKYHFVDAGAYETAAKYLEEAIEAGSRGEQGENLWTLAWIHILARDDEKAIAALERYLEAYPDADYTSNALFWSGKVHMRNGRIADRDRMFARLVETYPFSYYSYRARAIAGIAPSHDAGAPYPFPEGSAAPDDGLARIEELIAVGMETEAAREGKRLAAERPEDRVLAYRLADLYARVGEPLKAIGLLQRNFRDIIRHGGRDVPQRFWEILFPRIYWDAIRAAAERRQLDPYLLAAIIRQESGYDPTLVSNAGAVGLMQIMPAEVGRIAERGGLPPMTRGELFDPGKNIEAGAAEIVQKLEATQGDRVLAIAAYNAGEEAVGRWLANYADRDVDLFIEAIPYNETRLYVKSVLRNLNEYMRVYENSWSVAERDQRPSIAPPENR